MINIRYKMVREGVTPAAGKRSDARAKTSHYEGDRVPGAEASAGSEGEREWRVRIRQRRVIDLRLKTGKS